MSTLVGTAPNAMLAAFMLETYDADLSFSKWMLVGIPLSLVMAPLAWVALTRWTFKVDFATNDTGRLALKKMKDDLGSISTPEIRVGIIFLLLAVAWITRPILITLPGLSALDDSSIAMAGAISLFMIPSGDKTDPVLLRWIHLEKLPWSILLLFGGGLSLAAAAVALAIRSSHCKIRPSIIGGD